MLYIAFVLGGTFGLAYLLTGKKERQDELAFGPFLILGFVCALFFGDAILTLIWQ
jgi:prepilin signal peptidase PulO-like enzyme (type II secretory pathway)